MTGDSGKIKKEALGHFGKTQQVFLATLEGGQPRVRPVTMLQIDGRFWVLTGTGDAKSEQIRENPEMEFCFLIKQGEHTGYVRGSGSAKIVKGAILKKDIAKQCDYFYDHWKSPEDPNYALIELRPENIEYMRPTEMKARKFKL